MAEYKRSGAERFKRKKSNKLSNVLLVVGIVLIAVAAISLGTILYRYHEGDATYSAISEVADATLVASDEDAEVYKLDVDWDALEAQNPDIVAWVQIPDTVIDYPVVQADDNDYYLTHDFNKNSSSFGCLFLDCDNSKSFTDWNSLIYGHHMRNGSMLAGLVNYGDAEFYAAHPYIYLATPDGQTRRLQVFCMVKASGSEKLRQTEFANATEYQQAVQELLDRNQLDTDMTADQVGHVFEFITCSYEFTNARTIVCAVEVDVAGNPLSLSETTPVAAEADANAAEADADAA